MMASFALLQRGHAVPRHGQLDQRRRRRGWRGEEGARHALTQQQQCHLPMGMEGERKVDVRACGPRPLYNRKGT
jgi:hypothetical protein